MITNEDRAYLAATLDMEGTLGMYVPKNGGLLVQIAAVHNTEQALIDAVCEKLDQLGVRYYIGETGNHKQNPKHNECYRVRLFSKPSLQKYLLAVAPYLKSTKKRQLAAKILLWSRKR